MKSLMKLKEKIEFKLIFSMIIFLLCQTHILETT